MHTGPPPTTGSRCAWANGAPEYVAYHDEEWGTPLRGDDALFERLTLEAFQSGLSWLTILRKREAFREVFADFHADAVAAYDEHDEARLMADPRIVRNRLKVAAAVTNARATVALRQRGGLAAFIESFAPEVPPAPETTEELQTTSPESVALSYGPAAGGRTHVHARPSAEPLNSSDAEVIRAPRRCGATTWVR